MAYPTIQLKLYLLILVFISYNRLLVHIKETTSIQITHPILLPSLFVSVEDILPTKIQNNTVFVTVTTYGYKEFTKELYQLSNLQAYSNFFVVTHESGSYRVITFINLIMYSTSNI